MGWTSALLTMVIRGPPAAGAWTPWDPTAGPAEPSSFPGLKTHLCSELSVRTCRSEAASNAVIGLRRCQGHGSTRPRRPRPG